MTTPASPIQDLAQRLLADLIESGAEIGVQLAIHQHGRPIVDAFAGRLHANADEPVTGDTLFAVFSTGKAIAATAVHRLVEMGLLEYDKPIAHYWPEFAKHGKAGITLRHALSHTAGVPQMPDCTAEEIADWDRMCELVADLKPFWGPGERTHYHAITYGWLIGEPARRAAGRDFGRIVQEEVCVPLGMDAFYFGIPEALQSRVATMPEPAGNNFPTPAADDPVAGRNIPKNLWPLERWMNTPSICRGCIPASNALANARSISRHYAGLDLTRPNGETLLSKGTLREVTQLARPANPDSPPTKFALGYALFESADAAPRPFGHHGYGGSQGHLDRARGLAVGVTRNNTLQPFDAFQAAIDQIVAMIESQ